MKSYPASALAEGGEAAEAIASVLRDGGIACIPCGGTYRLVCDALDTGAVMRLMAVKRRTGHAPSLVFVADEAGLEQIAADVPEAAGALARELWPAPLTLLVRPGDLLPGKVVKQLTKANRRLGVRVPADPMMRAVVAAFDGPLLASSANREKKSGESSGAVVRQSFGARIDVFVDAGELSGVSRSTIVDVDEAGAATVTREGVISQERIDEVLTKAGYPPSRAR
ncbi:MAG: threonylcarbamoyl-AMP synthase [Deltaproteobacteria bacterium]|nr:MAG: threonylcarbamoyl-AMP synthase [Deltaproteobacteria bacterium]